VAGGAELRCDIVTSGPLAQQRRHPFAAQRARPQDGHAGLCQQLVDEQRFRALSRSPRTRDGEHRQVLDPAREVQQEAQ